MTPPVDGSTSPVEVHTYVLWARSRRYMTPFVAGAWSDGYRDVFPEQFWEEVEQAKTFITEQSHVSDGPWEFVITPQMLPSPTEPAWAAAQEDDDDD